MSTEDRATGQAPTSHPPTAGSHPPQPKRDPRDTARLIASGIIIIILIAFVVDNSQTVRVGFVFFSADVPLIWVLVVTALLGALADRLLQWRSRKKAADGRSRAKGGRGGR